MKNETELEKTNNIIPIGRQKERKIFFQILNSKEAEFITLYGRRRVGKTYFIENIVAPQCDITFTVRGIKDASLAEQLFHFKKEMERVFYGGLPIPSLNSWLEALEALANAVESIHNSKNPKNILLFFDELPWMAIPKSGLIQAIDYYWNSRFVKLNSVRLVACGSAAAWILDHLINNKGGLHNRVTRFIRLEPFTLSETQEYLKSRGIKLNCKQIIEIYMVMGGIPQYLRQVQQGSSPAQIIAQLCFEKDGYLRNEFDRLFSSLFDDAETFVDIVQALSTRRAGMDLEQLSENTKISMGGRLVKKLKQLEEAGFVGSFPSFGHKAKGTIYRLIDEYSIFYLNWILPHSQGLLSNSNSAAWENLFTSPKFATWCGYAYEALCFKHTPKIKEALGISHLTLWAGSWRYSPKEKKRTKTQPTYSDGAQIDLLFDRSDGVISLCEIKFTNTEFSIDKAYAKELQNKVEVFTAMTKTKKSVFLEMITSFGLKKNMYSEDLISHALTYEVFFEKN